jgi:hypothetical protein
VQEIAAFGVETVVGAGFAGTIPDDLTPEILGNIAQFVVAWA